MSRRHTHLTPKFLLCGTAIALAALLASAAPLSEASAATHPSPPAASPQGGLLVPAGENFSVRMPAAHSVGALDMPGLDGRVYVATSGGVRYAVKSIDYAGIGGLPSRLNSFASRYRDWFLGSAGGARLTPGRELSPNGRQYSFSGGGASGLARIYATARKVYVLEVWGGREGNAAVDQFLDSFKITGLFARDVIVPDAGGLLELEPSRRPRRTLPPPPPPPTPIPRPTPPPPLDPSCECATEENWDPRMVIEGGRVTRQAVICYKGELEYTPEAIKHQYSGAVILRVELLPDGRVGDVEVVQPQPYGLTESAIRTTRQFDFCPALRDGEPVLELLTYTAHFRITERRGTRASPRPRRRRP